MECLNIFGEKLQCCNGCPCYIWIVNSVVPWTFGSNSKKKLIIEILTWAVWYKTKFGSQNFGYQRWCIFSCDQAALWLVQSVRPSIRPSVCLSVCHTFLYPPKRSLGGVYWIHPVRPSVCLSVCPSVRPSVGRCPDDNSNSFQWI